MNYFALFCQCIIIIINYECYGQDFTPLFDLTRVQKVDSTSFNEPISNHVNISWSDSSQQYRIHAADHNDLRTFKKENMRIIFMVGNVVKIYVFDDPCNIWLCQFTSAIFARQFNHLNENSTEMSNSNNIPYFTIDIVKVFSLNSENSDEDQEFRQAKLYMKTYGQLTNNHRKFILKSQTETDQNQSTVMIFLSGRFNIYKNNNGLHILFRDIAQWSCTMSFDTAELSETVFNEISKYAYALKVENTDWIANERYEEEENRYINN